MRTAIVSDLHLGAASGEDVLRDPAVRRLLLEEIAGADRVVLLGDVVELRDLALGVALDSARPFFEELGEALGEREVTIVPGNHDHRLAEPLLDRLSLERRRAARARAARRRARRRRRRARSTAWLGPAQPADRLPRPLAARRRLRHPRPLHGRPPLPAAGRVPGRRHPDPPLRAAARPGDAGRLRAGAAADLRLQLRRRPGAGAGRPPPPPPFRSRLEGAGRRQRRGTGSRQRLRAASVRAAFPAGIWAINRLLHSEFERRHLRRRRSSPPGSTAGDRAGGATGGRRRPRDHRPHPPRRARPRAKPAWPLPGGGQLHNTGSWVFASAFHNPGHPAQPLLARHRHLGRGRPARRAGCSSCSTTPTAR